MMDGYGSQNCALYRGKKGSYVKKIGERPDWDQY